MKTLISQTETQMFGFFPSHPLRIIIEAFKPAYIFFPSMIFPKLGSIYSLEMLINCQKFSRLVLSSHAGDGVKVGSLFKL